MVTQVVQPPLPVANCFQLLKLLGGTIKSPHVYGLRERKKVLILYSVGIPYPSLIPRASCTFPVHYRKPLFPWDAHYPICHLVCTSLEGVLARQGLDGSRRRSAQRSWKDQVISPLVTFVHAIYNTEVPCCSRNKHVSVCLYVWEYLLYKN